MIHELRRYRFRPGGFDDYMALAGTAGLALRGTERGLLEGFWIVVDEAVDSVVHLWAYESLDHRQTVRASLLADVQWCDQFLSRVLPLMQSQTVSFLEPLSAIPTSDRRLGSARLVTLDAEPGGRGALVAAAATQFLSAPPRFALAGISPWPNSIVLLRGDAERDLVPAPAMAVREESIRVHPAPFSPIQ